MRAEILEAIDRMYRREWNYNQHEVVTRGTVGLGDHQPNIAAFEAVASRVESQGALIKCKSHAEYVARDASPFWVWAERVPYLPSGRLAGAHCFIRVPRDTSDPDNWVIDRPNWEEDCCSPQGRELFRFLSKCPADVACVTDLVADEAVRGTGLAFAAKRDAVRQLVRLNRDRRYPIRYLAGAIYSIRGAVRPDGSRVLLADHARPPLRNLASLRFNRHQYGSPVWIARDRIVPGLPGTPALLVDWEVYVITVASACGTAGATRSAV